MTYNYACVCKCWENGVKGLFLWTTANSWLLHNNSCIIALQIFIVHIYASFHIHTEQEWGVSKWVLLGKKLLSWVFFWPIESKNFEMWCHIYKVKRQDLTFYVNFFTFVPHCVDHLKIWLYFFKINNFFISKYHFISLFDFFFFFI